MKDPFKYIGLLSDFGILSLLNTLSYILISIFALRYFFPQYEELIIIGAILVNASRTLEGIDEVWGHYLFRKRRNTSPFPEAIFKDYATKEEEE